MLTGGVVGRRSEDQAVDLVAQLCWEGEEGHCGGLEARQYGSFVDGIAWRDAYSGDGEEEREEEEEAGGAVVAVLWWG